MSGDNQTLLLISRMRRTSMQGKMVSAAQSTKKNGVKTSNAPRVPNSKSMSAGLVTVSQRAIHRGVSHHIAISVLLILPFGTKLRRTETEIMTKAANVVSIG